MSHPYRYRRLSDQPRLKIVRCKIGAEPIHHVSEHLEIETALDMSGVESLSQSRASAGSWPVLCRFGGAHRHTAVDHWLPSPLYR